MGGSRLQQTMESTSSSPDMPGKCWMGKAWENNTNSLKPSLTTWLGTERQVAAEHCVVGRFKNSCGCYQTMLVFLVTSGRRGTLWCVHVICWTLLNLIASIKCFWIIYVYLFHNNTMLLFGHVEESCHMGNCLKGWSSGQIFYFIVYIFTVFFFYISFTV